MSMDLLKLFDLHYLFASVPGEQFKFRIVFVLAFVLVFAASFYVQKKLATRPLAKLEKNFFGGIPYRLQEIAIIGLLLTFLRDQNVPYLGARVWFLALGLSALAYALWIWRNYQKNFAKILVARENKSKVDHYLPKKGDKRRKRK